MQAIFGAAGQRPGRGGQQLIFMAAISRDYVGSWVGRRETGGGRPAGQGDTWAALTNCNQTCDVDGPAMVNDVIMKEWGARHGYARLLGSICRRGK